MPDSSHDLTGSLGPRVWAAMIVVYIIWGSTYLAIRVIVTDGLPPMVSMGSRFLVAGLLLALVLSARGGPRRLRVGRRELANNAMVGGFLLLGGTGLVAVAEQDVPSGLAALLVATTPLWLVGFRTASGDRPGWMTWLGTTVGFAGVAVLARPGGHSDDIPVSSTLIVVLATLLWASGSFASTRMTLPRDPFVAAVWQMVIAGVAMIAVGFGVGEGPRLFDVLAAGLPLGGIVAWGYLVVAGSLLAYTAYYWLLRQAPISLVSTYAYVNPVVAVVLGWALLSETVDATVLVGGGLAVVGVLLVVSTERHGHAHPPVPDAENAAKAAAAAGTRPERLVPSSDR